jgi:choline/glycine/proline betaine transport protein
VTPAPPAPIPPRTLATKPVFRASAALALAFVVAGVLAPRAIGAGAAWALAAIATAFGWLYVLTVATLLGVAVWLALGPHAQVRLGPDDARPEFSTATWLAMLFSAGMGIGLVFFAVAEPLIHYDAPPRATPRSVEAARDAMLITWMHWGLHAWAVYAVMGLALAIACFHRGLPLAIRSTVEPWLGRRTWGPWGDAIDVFATLGTLFGLATSLGLGAMQINAGLARVLGVPVGVLPQLVIVAVVTVAATLSVLSGLHAGIRRLSEANMVLAAILLVFVFIAGPTLFLLDAFVDHLGRYLAELVPRSLRRGAWREQDWAASWTIFYWGWWIAWAPFVGTFIARISRGRTIREFVVGVLLAPTLMTFVWLTVFGDTALWLQHHRADQTDLVAAVRGDVATAVFVLLEQLPLAACTSSLMLATIVLFFVTSSDSGSLVVDMITSGGDPDPPVGRRVFWALTEGAVAAALLLAGGLEALQAASVASGLPFAVLLLAAAAGLVRVLSRPRPPSTPP